MMISDRFYKKSLISALHFIFMVFVLCLCFPMGVILPVTKVIVVSVMQPALFRVVNCH